jgi:hypothetical protein
MMFDRSSFIFHTEDPRWEWTGEPVAAKGEEPMEGRYVDYPEPVLRPQFDRVETKKGSFMVLRLPLGKDRDGKPIDFAIGIRKARALGKHFEHIRRFVAIAEG